MHSSRVSLLEERGDSCLNDILLPKLILSFSVQFKKIVTHYKKTDYNRDIFRQTACMVVNPIMVDKFDSLFNCMTTGRFKN